MGSFFDSILICNGVCFQHLPVGAVSKIGERLKFVASL